MSGGKTAPSGTFYGLLAAVPAVLAGLLAVWKAFPPVFLGAPPPAKLGVPPLGLLLFGLAFLAGGVPVFLSVSRRVDGTARRERIRSQNPGVPWRWKKEWAAGVISAGGRDTAVGAAVLALVWNVSHGGVLIMGPESARAVPAVILSAATGAAIVAVAVHLWLQWWRFRGAVLKMQTVPCLVGGNLSGHVLVPSAALPEKGARVRLECVREHVVWAGGKNRREEDLFWVEEAAVPRAALVLRDGSLRVPVRFLIPPELPAMTGDISRDRIRYVLRVWAAVPGTDVSVLFHVPVFRRRSPRNTGGTAAPPEDELAAMALDEAGWPIPDPVVPDPSWVEETLKSAGVTVETFPVGGTALAFPLNREPDAAAAGLVSAIIWSIPVFVVNHSWPPFLVPALGVFLLFMGGVVLRVFFTRRGVVVDRSGIRTSTKIFGLGLGRRVSFRAIAGLDMRITMRLGTALFYSVFLVRRGGGRICVADHLRQDAARAVVAALETALRDYGGGAA